MVEEVREEELVSEQDGGSPMPSVDKALRALLILAEAGPNGISLNDLSRRLSLNKSSLHVTLTALKYRGFAAQSPVTGLYHLGSIAGQLSNTYLNSLDIRAMLRPAVHRLGQQINQVCHISVLDGTDVLYIDKYVSDQPIQAGTSIGMRLSALTTAMGRAMLAYEYDTYERFALRFEGALKPRQPTAPQTLPEAWERILDARRAGYGLDMEENVAGLTAVGVAILNGRQPVAAVSVVTLAAENGPAGPQRYIKQLRQALESAVQPPFRLPEPE